MNSVCCWGSLGEVGNNQGQQKLLLSEQTVKHASTCFIAVEKVGTYEEVKRDNESQMPKGRARIW
jgi:hypothetical protein